MRLGFVRLTSLCGFVLFAGPEAGIHLGEVYRATGQNVPLLDELLKKFGAAKPAVEVVEND